MTQAQRDNLRTFAKYLLLTSINYGDPNNAIDAIASELAKRLDLSSLRHMGDVAGSMLPPGAWGTADQLLMDGTRNRVLDAVEHLILPSGKHSAEEAVAMLRPPSVEPSAGGDN